MPATDLPLLIDTARAAGDIACRYSGPEAKRWEKPGGAGPVTEADLAVNEMLEDRLRAARPDYGWLSEESEDNADRLGHDRIFIVDPIDGTRGFAEGDSNWAHALAVTEAGRVTAAVIYLPMRDLLYSAARGAGAWLNGTPIQAANATDLAQATILATRPNLDPRHWRGGIFPGFKSAYRSSLAFRMALVAQGRFDAMLTLRPSWEWDIAAGDLILSEAGARCTDRNGTELRFNNPRPQVNGVIAAGPRLHDRLATALAPELVLPDPAQPGS
ncbi:inositol monophosphatase family protein [Pseudodonghicola xiamenensis]|uniref:3'(2'),5'-bisphosphate nucleotidase CysQ n=1 Tax=Pseudodonghicola xiamenensis TaxID=337702 RepID=A0A8J3H5F4_9RHOB|nr:3'(2'),5'-bisphosphate nucleotidase CysQ [Pseudodonghicola xiamenensis]GHG82307.1 3'(2'),5'-bisphosphate nucleotidase CysQ [Pseudodonghicola xiamenensis]